MILRSIMRRIRPFLPRRPAILMYHRIAAESFDPFGLAVSPTNFAEQVDWLKRTSTVLPLADLARLGKAGTLPRNAIALTFDDGYACTAEVAAPILARAGLPATIFLPVDLLEGSPGFWWDELERIVFTTRQPSLALASERYSLDGTGPEQRKAAREEAFRTLWTRLHAQSAADRARSMDALRSQAGVETDGTSFRPTLARDDVRAMRSELIDFGSHALTHPSLPSLDPEEKEFEIRESFARCEELTGTAPRSFAYPFGDWDAQSERLVQQAGFDCACTTRGGFIKRSSRPFALPRIWVGDWRAGKLAHVLGAA